MPVNRAGEHTCASLCLFPALSMPSSRGAGFDYIVAPSGSCVHHLRSNFDAIEHTEEVKRVAPDLPEEIATAHKLSRLVRCWGRGYCRPTSASLVNKRLFLSHGLVVLDPRVTIYWREHCAA
jgi:hypothetical protein